MKEYPKFDTSFMWGNPGRYQVPQPQQFNDTMTQLQKMNTLDSHMSYLDRKMYETIIHVDSVASVTEHNIKDINQGVNEFKQETTENIETFENNMRDFYMPASVEIILDEWTNEGKFEDIIESTVFKEFNEELSNIPKLSNTLNIGKKARMIGHMGSPLLAPENSIPSYVFAGKNGMWGAECDTQPTSDGVWVLMHDTTVDRTTDGTGNIQEMTYSQVSNLTIDAGNNVGLYPNLKVPTLEEYLVICNQYGMTPVIEIKIISNTNHYNQFVQTIKDYGFEENCIVISFSHQALVHIRNRSSKIVLQLIADVIPDNIDFLQSLSNAGFSVDNNSLTKEKIRMAHEAGLLIGTWTVNNASTAKKLVSWGIDYITTELLAEVY